MKPGFGSLACLFVIASASGPAFAQTSADSGTAPSPPLEVIRLTPPTPSGGIYGVESTPVDATSPTDDAASAASTSPSANPTAPTLSPPAPPAPPVTSSTLAPPPPLALTPPEVLAPRRHGLMRERLRLLNTLLPPVAARSRSARIMDGVVSLIIGTGIGALSFFVPSSPTDLRPWFWASAGVSIVSGGLSLFWVPARESLTRRFENLPMDTAPQRRARVHFGERALEEMAADGSRRRVLGAVANATVSLAMLAVIYREPIFDGAPYTVGVFDYLVIGFTGLSVVTSMLQLFGRSEDERLRDSYWQQVRLLRAEQGVGGR